MGPTTFKRPDLKAPRFRRGGTKPLKKELYYTFLKLYPQYAEVTFDAFKQIIKTDNTNIWNHVVDNRDGVELREQLGNIFIGTTSAPKAENVDYGKSIKTGQRVLHKNWESDNRLGKIVYSNCMSKYTFANRELWYFTAGREFKRESSAAVKKDYKKYIEFNNTIRASNLLSMKKSQKAEYFKSIQPKAPEDYNEFNLD